MRKMKSFWERYALCFAVCIACGFVLHAHAATYTVTNLEDSGAGSLRQAILDAENQPGEDTIEFQPGLRGTCFLTAPLMVNSSVTITGPGPSQFKISGRFRNRVLEIRGDDTVVAITGMTIADGLALDAVEHGFSGRMTLGGGILIWGAELSLSNVLVMNHLAIAQAVDVTAGGGAIACIYGASLHATDTRFEDNQTVGPRNGYRDSEGGAIFSDASVVDLAGCSFTGNLAFEGGYFGSFAGAIYSVDGSQATIYDCTFKDNGAYGRTGKDGGPGEDGGAATGGRGGAILCGSGGILDAEAGSALFISHSVFDNNLAIGSDGGDGGSGGYGGRGGKAISGAVIVSGGGSKVEIRSCYFFRNQALGGKGGDGGSGHSGHYGGDAMGGALSTGSADLIVMDSIFDDNEAIAGAGGNEGTGSAGLSGGDAIGGAISSSVLTMTPDVYSKLEVDRCSFTGNRAIGGDSGDGHFGGYNTGSYGQGGAIAAWQGTMTLSRCTFTDNEAIGGEGGDAHDFSGSGGIGIGAGVVCGALSGWTVGTISGCLFEDNMALGGTGGSGAIGGNAMGAGIGGGAGAITITGCNLIGNQAIGGTGGLEADGGTALGGGFLNFGTGVLAKKNLITLNAAVGGAAGAGGSPGVGMGGGVYNMGTLTVSTQTEIVDNTADILPDCAGCP